MTCAAQRMLYGHTSANRPSRFLGEIPDERVERSGRSPMSPGSDWPLGESEWRPEREHYGSGERSRSAFRAYNGYAAAKRTTPKYDRGYTAPRETTARTGAVTSASLPDFQKGEMVRHKAFGKGMILSLTKMGGDALIEVAFDNVGTKKLMLKSAAQYMEKLS